MQIIGRSPWGWGPSGGTVLSETRQDRPDDRGGRVEHYGAATLGDGLSHERYGGRSGMPFRLCPETDRQLAKWPTAGRREAENAVADS